MPRCGRGASRSIAASLRQQAAEAFAGELLGRAYGVAARARELADARGARYDDARVKGFWKEHWGEYASFKDSEGNYLCVHEGAH